MVDPRTQPIYKESSPWPGWILVMFWGTMFLSMVFVSLASAEADDDRIVGMVILVAVAAAVQLLLSGLTVRLFRDEMVVGLGSLGLIRKRISYTDIVRTESVKYNPLREFGGWGIRWGKGGKKAWTARGDHAVVLHLRDGTRLYVGSDTPGRLEERIRAVAGTRLGGEG